MVDLDAGREGEVNDWMWAVAGDKDESYVIFADIARQLQRLIA